jgi:hypothetical protein
MIIMTTYKFNNIQFNTCCTKCPFRECLEKYSSYEECREIQNAKCPTRYPHCPDCKVLECMEGEG